jgi:syringomycin synthetase protein SyrE
MELSEAQKAISEQREQVQSDAAPIREDLPAALVTIQGGRRGTCPVFCVPGAGAGIADFVSLSSALGEDCPVHGFQPRGMDGVALPYSSVESAAESYLRELDSLHHDGSVCLVGHSFGGWVAFEMALRLQAAHRQSSVLILDSEVPGKTDERFEYTRPEALMELVELYELAVERPLDVRLSDLEAREPEEQLAYLHERMVRVGLLPKSSRPGVLLGPVRNFESALRTRYQPGGIFNGSVKLLLVPSVGEEECEASCRFERDLAGWKRFAPHIQFRRGTGNHLTLLRPSNVKIWAQWVTDSRDRRGISTASNVAVPPSRRLLPDANPVVPVR